MKLWSGRLKGDVNELLNDLNASIGFDSRMIVQDITGSIAHATMLGEVGVITPGESAQIVEGLKGILADVQSGALPIDMTSEDVHTFVEQTLTARIGDAGKRLHTGRSRNDQVALDFRMYMKARENEAIEKLKSLILALCKIAKANTGTIMPAYTHLQKAQPTTLGHYMAAYAEMFKRDCTRFQDCLARTDFMPLGSGALCATTYPLDRAAVADELGFSAVTPNSLDGVSDRDFALEFLSAASITMMHLSRFCEELILWSTGEFAFISMDDAFSTGSSIMPQKKNPDMAELIRGKTGRVYGSLMSLLTVMKGLPLAYNKDMQEDKECVFDAADTLLCSLHVFTDMISTVTFRKENMLNAAGKGFTNATDAADYLVKKGLPFRDAHAILGRLVLHCEQNGLALGDLSLSELREFSDVFDEDVFDAISLETCINSRCIVGGPSPAGVAVHIGQLEAFCKS